MDPFSEDSAHNSVDATATMGKDKSSRSNRRSVKEIHVKGSSVTMDDSSFRSEVSAASSSAYDGDYASASEASGFFSESATDSLSAAINIPTNPHKKVKRKKPVAKKGTAAAATTTTAAEVTPETAEGQPPKSATKKPSKKAAAKKKVADGVYVHGQQHTNHSHNDSTDFDSVVPSVIPKKKKKKKKKKEGEEGEYFNASTLKAGLTMEDFSAVSNTDGETDVSTRRRRKPKPRQDDVPVQPNRSHRDSHATTSTTTEADPDAMVSEAETNANDADDDATAVLNKKPKRKSKVTKRRPSVEQTVPVMAANNSNTNSNDKKLAVVMTANNNNSSNSKKLAEALNVTEHSFAEDSFIKQQNANGNGDEDQSIHDDQSIAIMEALNDAKSRRTAKLLATLEEESANAEAKESSMDAANHNSAATLATSPQDLEASAASGMTAITTNSKMTPRSKSPETRKRLAAQKRNTTDSGISRPVTSATSNDINNKSTSGRSKSRRKSHGTVGDEMDNDNSKSSRKTLGSIGSESTRASTKKRRPSTGGSTRRPSATGSSTRRPSATGCSTRRPSATGGSQKSTPKQRSHSLNMTSGAEPTDTNKSRSRRMTVAEGSPAGLDQSVQSMAATMMVSPTKSYDESPSKLNNKNKKASSHKRTSCKDLKKKALPLDEDDSIVSTVATTTSIESMMQMAEAKRSSASGLIISPFEQQAGKDVDVDDDQSRLSEASTIYSTASSNDNQRQSLSKRDTELRSSANQNAAVNPYFSTNKGDESGTDNEKDVSAKKGRESMSEVAGSLSTFSLLSDYSNGGGRERTRKDASPFAESSEAEQSAAASKVISPFSSHAGQLQRNASATSLLPTENINAPLIPDSDDEDNNGSFHADVPEPISSVVNDCPPTSMPPLRKSLKKESAPKKEGSSAAFAIQGPVEIKGPAVSPKKEEKKEAALTKSPTKLDDLDMDDGPEVPHREINIATKPKSSLWDLLCCRSTTAVAL